MQGPNNELIFVFIGTENYHFMIKRNIELLWRVYPNAPVLVYDWGDGHGTRSSTVFPKSAEVINWCDRVMDTWHLMEIYSEKRRIEIGKTFNSRMKGGFNKRLEKFFLKRFPNSAKARAAIERGLRYENMLLHKSYNLIECSKYLIGRRFFLLDADAFLVEPIHDIYIDDPDLIIPMIDPSIHGWGYNDCHGLSTGVIGFGANSLARDTFLSEWYEAIRKNDEWLRELAAMNRMIKSMSPSLFNTWGLNTLAFGAQDVKIRTVENDVYNCYFNYQDRPPNFNRAKILHLAGIAQRPHLFDEYFSKVEKELERRL